MLGTFLLLSICPLIFIFFFAIYSSEKALSISGNRINNILLDYVIFLHRENLTKQTEIINEKISSIKKQVHVVQAEAEDVFSNPLLPKDYHLSLQKEKEGYYWEDIKGDVSNVGMSSPLELTKDIKYKLLKSKLLEKEFIQIYNQEKSISRIYYMGTQSYWRIYPKENVKESREKGRYKPYYDFTTWPFYTLAASAKRNHEVWTKPSNEVDNMFTLSMPIFENKSDFKGVIGVDISVPKFLDKFLNFRFKEPSAYAILISSPDHKIIASQQKAQKDLRYFTTNVIQKLYDSEQPLFMKINHSEKIILVSTVKETNGKIVYVIPKKEIISSVKSSIENQLGTYIRTFTIQFICLLITIICILVAVTFMIWKHYSKPFNEVLQGISSISSEKFQVRIKDQRLEEFQLFTQSFNMMAKKIDDLITNYKLLNLYLEEKVSDRTTKLYIANETLKQTNDKLITMEKTRRAMFANIAHDLKTPITVVLGYIEAINDKMINSEQIDEYLHRIHKHLYSINNLVKGVYELNHVEMSEQVFHYQIVQANEFFMHVEDLLKHDSNIHVYVEEKLPSLKIDIKYLERAILNLVENSIKYSNSNTPIVINVSSDRTQIVVSVRDYGWGIPHEDLPYIFDRFYRVDRARNSSKAGNGLGLSIVKEIIYAHGGTIEVQSELEKGTEFVIKLPIYDNERVYVR
ncbi:ATP-binding protein [Bacillus sp. AFS031507]|uniref:sensor histidine kinase n=1 Tax=Bacillus sp. AFS031507 TaxID=2033496 RepID=UPI0015D49361|nr:ATP-binding protein [Bacillus sp. AFS031507]